MRSIYNQNKIDICDAPANDYRAIGLVERVIQTVKRRLLCPLNEEKDE